MNKLTSTLAGLALVAGASVAPAFAQGAFLPSSSGTFSFVGSSFAVNGITASYYNFATNTLYTGTANITGGTAQAAHPDSYDFSTLTFTDGTYNLTDIGTAALTFTGTAPTQLVSVSAGNGFNNSFKFGQYKVPAVPETSTVASFGVLLALGGVALLRRKSVKNAA